jgi:riboflavin kinase/FMN adenylyltransferase
MPTELFSWDKELPASWRGGAVTIGNFDGVHRGHAALLTELVHQARAVGGPAVVLTFDPHPLQLLRPQHFLPVLTTVAQRAELLRGLGADHIVVLPTTPELLRLRAEEFFNLVVRDRLAARALVEGANFGFGRDREGNIDTLRRLCIANGLGLLVVPSFALDGAPVSSSRIRQALLSGVVREAASLLGRLYRLSGVVGTGQRRGQSLGFPTANLTQIATLVPGDGVYAVRVHHRGRTWPGAANVGPNPTFGEQARKVEVHLIGFRGDLYDQTLDVDFLERLRETRPFAGVPQLVEQLHRDVEQARRLAEARS